MARTQLATQAVPDPGLVNPTFSAANADGHMLDGDARLEVFNGNAGSINLTLQTGGTLAGLAVADTVIAIPAGQRWRGRKLDQRAYPRPTGVADAGKIYIDFSVVSSVTCAAFRD